MYFPNFVAPPITDRTAADIAEVKALLTGSHIYDDLYAKDGDLYDKANADLYAQRNPYGYKGALNYTDLNRIEYNFMECAKALVDWGYPIRQLESVEDESMCSSGYMWNMKKLPHVAQINRIRDNARLIQQNFLQNAVPQSISYASNLHYEDVNLLENIAYMTDVVLHRIEESAIYCGEVICGGV